MPWITCAPGMPRAVAQLLGHILIPELLSSTSIPIDPGKRALLQSIWDFIDSNKDLKKLRIKQIRFFTQYSLQYKLSVAGILSLPEDVSGERIPVHILTDLINELKTKTDEENENDLSVPNITHVSTMGNISDIPLTIQTKRITYDTLQLPDCLSNTNNTQTHLRHCHSVKRPRQHVIVVASLISKITNIAG